MSLDRQGDRFGTNRSRALYKRTLSIKKRCSDRFARAFDALTIATGDPLNWPEHICAERKGRQAHESEDFRRLLLKSHLKHGERFKLTLFLLSNGVAPWIIKEYYRANCSLRDESAERSVAAMIDEFGSPTSDKWKAWTSFDLVTRRWEKMAGDKNDRR